MKHAESKKSFFYLDKSQSNIHDSSAYDPLFGRGVILSPGTGCRTRIRTRSRSNASAVQREHHVVLTRSTGGALGPTDSAPVRCAAATPRTSADRRPGGFRARSRRRESDKTGGRNGPRRPWRPPSAGGRRPAATCRTSWPVSLTRTFRP